MHNLFGDTHAINVELLPDGGYRLDAPEFGDKVDELLSMVHFSPERLLAVYHEKVAAAGFSAERQAALCDELEHGLHGYTYLGD